MAESNPRTRSRGHAALRRGRVSLVGQVYLVTFVTHGRRPVFQDAIHALDAVRAMIDARVWRSSRCLAWVLMPDHWHGLVQLGEADELSRLVRRLKASTARSVSGVDAPLWAPAFHDHALRSEEDLLSCARYLVLNPVRAGLVRRVGDYPYWDAVWL